MSRRPYSILSRGPEEEILPTLGELGIGFTAYGVLSRGLLSGHWSRGRRLGGDDFRAISPRFRGENLEHNLAPIEQLRAIADEQLTSVMIADADERLRRLVAAAHGSSWWSRQPRRSRRLTQTGNLSGLEFTAPQRRDPPHRSRP